MHFKPLFDKQSKKVLGAQAVGKGMDGTIENLKNLELAYSPMHGTAKDVVNVAGLAVENILNGDLEQVPVSKVRELVEADAYIIDVGEANEYEAEHLKGSHNIPLSELRNRMDEISQDIPVYLHCRTGQCSYNVVRILKNNGFGNVINISGSYLSLQNITSIKCQALCRQNIYRVLFIF
ncbi:hypothetical protein K6L05_10065 [Salinicoccus roseus]|nr:hypothetical protein [Salinicoccus roseus]